MVNPRSRRPWRCLSIHNVSWRRLVHVGMGLQLKDKKQDIHQEENLFPKYQRAGLPSHARQTHYTGSTADLQRLFIGVAVVPEGRMERILKASVQDPPPL